MWTCGDYDNDFTNIASGFTLTLSSEHTVNGDHSIKVENEKTGYTYMWLGEVSCDINDIYTATIGIYNNSSTQVSLRLIETGNNNYNDISIPPNNSIQTISITRTITSTSALKFYLVIREPATVYIDNITLNKR